VVVETKKWLRKQICGGGKTFKKKEEKKEKNWSNGILFPFHFSIIKATKEQENFIIPLFHFAF
jgi:hypothetical protein